MTFPARILLGLALMQILVAAGEPPCPVGKVRRKARQLGMAPGPCHTPTCGLDYNGTCKAGMKPAHAYKVCPGGNDGGCTEAICCVPRLCDHTNTAALCVGQYVPKTDLFVASDYQFSSVGATNCSAGYSEMRSPAACQAAAEMLGVAYNGKLAKASAHYPYGCFQCDSSDEACAALSKTNPGLFWNDFESSPDSEVSTERHIGTKTPCMKDPPACGITGCTAATCCGILTCATNFNETCDAGEVTNAPNTMCNVNGTFAATKCKRTECCSPKSCGTDDLGKICSGGFVADKTKKNAVCPAAGCDTPTCCAEATCSNDFTDQCGAGEDLQSTRRCKVEGCTKETCCRPKTCAEFTCKNCADPTEPDWIARQGTIYCLSTGCDENTCCKQLSCGLDFDNEQCGNQDPADPHTMCIGSTCTAEVCCKPKLCETFSCSAPGLPIGLRAMPAGTRCAASGCDQASCCAAVTCGTDFNADGCGAWSTPRALDTVCKSGKCDQKNCCAKKECVIHQASCNTDKIKTITDFTGISTDFKYPNANNNAAEAEGACASLDRSECFATLDVNCDGQQLQRCVPNHANDPYSLVLRPSTKSCVCYRQEQPTCGYNMPEGTFCGAGEQLQFYTPCGGSTGSLCNPTTCCKPMTCKSSYFRCGAGQTWLGDDIVCPKDGCSEATCCAAVTCSSGFTDSCPTGTVPVDGSTACLSGQCSSATCCQATPCTTLPPPHSVCETDFRGACADDEEFAPEAQCSQVQYRLGDKDTNQCPIGFNRIVDVEECIAGTMSMVNDLGLTHEGGVAMPTDEASITAEIQKRTIASGSGVGEQAPLGCYYASQNQYVNGDQMKINSVGLNLDQTVASRLLSCVDGRRLDGSPCTTAPPSTPSPCTTAPPHTTAMPCTTAPPPPPPTAHALICASNAGCTRNTCCKPHGSLHTCKEFDGCNAAAGLIRKTGHIMCAAAGCDTQQCCKPLTCGDFFSKNVTSEEGDCAAHQHRLPHSTVCNGDCSRAFCCKDAPPTTTTINPCTTVPNVTWYQTWYYEPFQGGAAVRCGAQNKIQCASDDGKDCAWGRYQGQEAYHPVGGVDADTLFIESDCPGWNTDTDACQKLGCYGINAICRRNFILGEKDTTACPAGFKPIETVETCVQAAQFLNIQPSDTNGDGSVVSVQDTAALTEFIKQREFAASDALGVHKPHGCYADKSIRLINGVQQRVTTIWVNHRVDGAGPHDNSMPICQTDCGGVKMLQRDDARYAKATRQQLSQKADQGQIPTFAIAALSAFAFLTVVTFVIRRSGTSSSARSSRASLTRLPQEDDSGDLSGLE